MTITLKRIESKDCYLRGKLFIDEKYHCDTQEFNNETSLKKGQYKIAIYNEPQSKEKRVYILTKEDKIISKLERDNCDYINSIPVRRKNQLIEIGLYNRTAYLVMFNYINQSIITAINKAKQINETIELIIENEISDNYIEENQTNY